MVEPSAAVATGFAVGTVGAVLSAVFPEATPAVLICSLAGSAVFVLTNESHQLWKQILFAVVSFLGGIYCAGVASDIISAVANAALRHIDPQAPAIIFPRAVGALVASAISVTVLLRVLSKSKTINITPKNSSGENK